MAILLHDDRGAATLRYRPPNLVHYARRHGPCPVRVSCVRAVCYRNALCGLKISHHTTISHGKSFFIGKLYRIDRPFFFREWLYRRPGFTQPARHGGTGGVTRETDSIFSTLGARRAGHGARARARLAGGRVSGRFPVGRPERRRDRPVEPGAKNPRPSEKTRFYFVIYHTEYCI